jgi:uncharacterized delta-60 repeat protein
MSGGFLEGFLSENKDMTFYTSTIKFVVIAILFFGLAIECVAAEGDLDPSFGTGGIVITDNGSSYDDVLDLTIQPDGKIIAVGYSPVGSEDRTVVVRYNPDGSIDPGFGTNGRVIVQFVCPAELALQQDGKIVFVGTMGTYPNGDIYVARLSPDGGFDSTFNGSGNRILDLRGTHDDANSVQIQTDGKIVVGGQSARTPSRPDFEFALVRLNNNGSLDNAFDGDGKVFTTLNEISGVSKLIVQADGRIVAAGSAYTFDPIQYNYYGYFAVVRYNTDGSVDTDFGNNGFVLTTLLEPGPGHGWPNPGTTSAAQQADGKIVVIGYVTYSSPIPTTLFALVRYEMDGTLDPTFGAAGKVIISLPDFYSYSTAADIAMQSDGKIVVGGTIGRWGKPGVRRAGAVRFDRDGSLDTSFSGDGMSFVTATETGSANAVAIQNDGKIVIGGQGGPQFGPDDFLLARFIGACSVNCAVTRQHIVDFDGDGKTDLSIFRNGTWYINPSGLNDPGSYYGVQFGLPTDRLTPADFDGDGKTDIAVWRENVNGTFGYFYILQSQTNTFQAYQFGQTGDDPSVVGDWDGDGTADLAVYRDGTTPGAQSYFYYRPSSDPATDYATVYWGTAGDETLRGDFDGDGRLDASVFRPSDGVWYILQSSNSQPRYAYSGVASDKRVSGDFDGDGKTDLAIFHEGLWAVLQSSNNQDLYRWWGLPTDTLVPGDYDGDGRTDFAVWRDGIYYILPNSSGQPVYRQFGQPGDIPAASAFIH